MSQKQDQYRAYIEFLDILQRYRWRFILPAFIVTATVLGISLFLPRKYKSEAIFERRMDMVLTEITNRGATKPNQYSINSLREEIVGKPAIDEVIREIEPELNRLGLIRTPLDRHLLRNDLFRKVLVEKIISTGDVTRIKVEYIGTDPNLTSMAVNGLVASYIHRTESLMEDRLKESAKFFRDEVARNQKMIENLENQLLEYEIEHAELLPEHPNNLQTQIADSKTKLSDLINRRDSLNVRISALETSIADEPESIPLVTKSKNPDLTRMEEKLRELNKQMATFTGVYKMRDRHPDLLALMQQIEQLEKTISETEQEIITQRQFETNQKRTDMELQLTIAQNDFQSIEKEIASLRRTIEQKEKESELLFPIRSNYRRLNREMSLLTRQIGFWEDNLRRVEMALAAETGNRGISLEFLKYAEPITKPVSPQLAQVLMAAISLGLMAGSFSVLFAYRTDESFSTGDQINKEFNLPVIGSVSEIISRQNRRVRRLRNMILYPANAIVMGSLLAGIALLLYFDLEKPHQLDNLKKHPITWITGESVNDIAPIQQNSD